MSATRLDILSRFGASLLGGYAFTWGYSALGIAALAAMNVDFHEADTAVQMLAFLVFLAVFLWAYAVRSLVRLWAVVAGGGLLMNLAAWMLQRAVLA